MAQPEIVKDINDQVSAVDPNGDTMIGKLIINKVIQSNAIASDVSLSRIPSEGEIALQTGNGNGVQSAWIWRENYPFSNWGIFHDNSSDVLHIVGNSISRFSVNLGNGTVTIPGNLTVNGTLFSSFLDGKYVLKSGDTMTGNLLIQKPAPEILLYNTISDSCSIIRLGELDKPHSVMFHNASSRTDDGGANLFTIRNDTGGGIRLDSDTRITGYLTVGQQILNTEATLYVNGTSKFNNKVYIGNTTGINELTIYGVLSTTNAGFQDGADRPSLKILGYYPQIVLMGGGASNGNHGATLSIGAWDDPQAKTADFKTWTFGTPGYNATWMDLAYNINGTNPHNGINNWTSNGTYHRLMRFEGAPPKIIGYGRMIVTPPDFTDVASGNQALRVIQSHSGGGGVCSSAAVFSHIHGTHDYGVVMNLNIQSNTGDFPSLRFSVGNYETKTDGTTSWSLGYCCGGGADYHFRIKRNHGWNGWGDEALRIDSNSLSVYVSSLYGAVWNDYAEYRKAESIEPGRVVIESEDGEMKLSTERLQPGAEIISDTFGFAIGETDEYKTPIAAAGRVLAYPNEDRYSYPLGCAVCSGPNGTVSQMTREEIKEYPERIIGTVSEIPEYEYWGTGNVEVKNRIWIKVK